MESFEAVVEKLKSDEPSIHRTTIQKFKLPKSLTIEQTKLLHELISDNSTPKSYESISILTQLTLDKKIKSGDVLELFTNKVTSVPLSTLSHLVECIIKIIQIEKHQKGDILVSISDIRKEINQILIHLTPKLLQDDEKNFEVLSPFFGKIFSSQLFGLSFQLLRSIINVAIYHKNPAFSTKILKFLMNYLTVFPIDSNDIFSSCFWQNQAVLDLIIHLYGKEEEIPTYVILMTKHLFSLYKEVKTLKKDTNPVLGMLKIVFQVWEELLVEFLPVISSFLLGAETSAEWSIFNEFIYDSIEIIHENEELGSEKMRIYSTILPLLHVLSTGPQEISKFATVSLNRVENILRRKMIDNDLISNDINDFKMSDIIFARSEVILHQNFDAICRYISKNLGNFLNSSLELMKEPLNGNFQNLNYFCVILGIVFLETRNMQKERTDCLDFLEKLSNQFPLKIGLFFLPLLLYEISRENNSRIKLEIMNYIPLIGTSNFIVVNTANKILNSFMQNKSLIPISIQLFTKLWLKNDRFFSNLKSILGKLIETSGGVSSLDLETRISLAQVLKIVAEKSPSKGIELLAPLSTILTKETHPTVVVLGMQALGYLCKSDVLDFYLAWFRLVSKHIMVQSQKSTLVLSEMCKLFENGVEHFVSSSELDYDYESENMDELKILIAILLDQITHKDELVRISAYETLSKYSLNALIFAISEEEVQEESIGEEEAEEIEIDIFTQMEIYKELVIEFTGIVMPPLLQEKSPNVLKAAKNLVAKIMTFELQKPLGTNVVSKEKSFIKELDLLENLPRFIVSEYKKSSIQQTISTSVLWGYKGDSNSNYSSKSYSSTFRDLISVVSVESDLFAHLLMYYGIVRFISNYFNCLVDEKSVGEKSKSVDHFNSAFNVIFTEIKKLLKTLTIPSEVEIAIASLGALCLVLPPSSYQNVQHVIKYLNDFSSTANEEWILFACNFSIVCASFELRNHSQIDSIVNGLCKQLNKSKEPYSTGIPLGMITTHLCHSQAIQNVEDVEKKTVLNIYEELMSISFKSKKVDATHRISTVLGLSSLSGALIRSMEFDKVDAIYTNIFQEVLELNDNLSKNIKYETYSFQCSCFVALPNVVVGLYKVDKFDQVKLENLLKIYWEVIEFCESQSLSSYTNLYRNTCLGLGTLIFSILKSGYSMTPLRVSEYLSHFTTVAQTNNTSNIRIGSLLFILSVNGFNVLEPFTDVQDTNDVKNLYEAFGSDKRILPMVLDVIQVVKKLFEESDSKVRRYSSMLLGILSDRYQINSNITGDKSRVPLDTLNEEGFSFNFSRMISDSEEKLPEHTTQFLLDCFLDVDYLPNIQWAQRLNQLMKSQKNKDIKQSIIKLLSKEAETSVSKSNSLKVISSMYETDQFKSLDAEVKQALIEVFPNVSTLFTIPKSQSVLNEISSLIFEESHQMFVTKSLESLMKNPKTPKELSHFIVDLLTRIVSNFSKWDRKTINVMKCISKIFAQASNIIDIVTGKGFYASVLKILIFHWSNSKPKSLLEQVQNSIFLMEKPQVSIISNLVSHVLILSTTFDVNDLVADSIGLLSHTIMNEKQFENIEKMMNFVGIMCISVSTLNYFMIHLNHSLLNPHSNVDSIDVSLGNDAIIFGIVNMLNSSSIERSMKIDFIGNLYTYLFSNEPTNQTTIQFILPLLINIQSHPLVNESKSRWIQYLEKTAVKTIFE